MIAADWCLVNWAFVCTFACNLTLVIKCVYRIAFLHACRWKKKISELLSIARNVCLLILNAHRYLAQLDANPQNTQTHTTVPSVMSCHSLLGLAFSLARGLDPLSEALNSGPSPPPPWYSRKHGTRQRQTGEESQGAFIMSLNLYLIICWNVPCAAWVLTEPSSSVSKPAPLPHMIASSSKLLHGRPQASWRPAAGETIQAYRSTFAVWKTLPYTFNYIPYKWAPEELIAD